MNKPGFSITKAMDFGFRSLGRNFGLFFLMATIFFLVGLGFMVGVIAIRNFTPYMLPVIIPFNFLFYSLFYVIFISLKLGAFRIGLDVYDKGVSQLNKLFSCFYLFIPYFFAFILYQLLTFIGFILLIIPGIIWSLKYGFFDLFIVDTDCGPIEAMKKSAIITIGSKWRLFLYYISSAMIFTLSCITIIGPLFVGPALFYLGRIYIYRTLLKNRAGMLNSLL